MNSNDGLVAVMQFHGVVFGTGELAATASTNDADGRSQDRRCWSLKLSRRG